MPAWSRSRRRDRFLGLNGGEDLRKQIFPFSCVSSLAAPQTGEASREIRSRDPDRAGIEKRLFRPGAAATNAYTL
jgi:hypothetical protein